MLGEPIRDRRAERHEATRAEILTAAWAVAREQGIAALSLRDVARRVGMQAPSLYSYFTSKNDIYDAMFAQAWTDALDGIRTLKQTLSDEPREALRTAQLWFFDFAVSDPARYLLMGQRTIPGFEPSPQAYAPAVAVIDETKALLGSFGITSDDDVDLWITLSAGCIAQQTANEPGGTRWRLVLDRSVDFYCDALGITKSQRPATKAKKPIGGKR
ncbi:MAG: hypothetical protein QOG53_1764 [Frankiales bacterium]|jgi:AcrR family transcriptional regulator|nr:hypothetical protein [Frankiales bacterium]